VNSFGWLSNRPRCEALFSLVEFGERLERDENVEEIRSTRKRADSSEIRQGDSLVETSQSIGLGLGFGEIEERR